MYTSQAPPAYLPTAAPPPPGAVTFYTTASVGNGSLHNFAVSPTAAGGALPQPIAMASSGTAVLVAPQGLMASSAGAAGPPGLSTSGAGSFAASSGHGSLSHPFSMPSLPMMSAMGGGPGMTSLTGNTNVQGVTFRNLKVGGLPPCVTDADLFDMFQRFGKIESAKVMLNVHTCESRGYGFVLYDTQEAGCRAFGEMNGKTLVLRGVEMTLDVKNSDWDGRQAVIEVSSIYVRNIPNSVSDEELKKYFTQFGPILNLSSRTAGPAVTAASVATVAPPAHTPGGSSVPSGVLSNHNNNNNNLSITGPPSQAAEADNGSVASGHGGGGDGGSSTIEQQLQTLLDDDEASETGRTTTASGSTTEQRNTPVPQPPSRSSGQSLSLDPPSFASFDFTGEPLGKLAMVEFQTIDSARLAIAATHRMMVFPNASTPVLSKFADAPHVKEQRRNQRKLAQPLPVQPLTTQHPPPPLQPPPPQQQYIAVVGSAQSFPSMSLSSNPQPIAMSMPRFPEAVPLPVQLPRPGATHRLYYQGLLGLASDGTLFAIRPDVCVQVANQQQAEAPGAAQQRHPSHAQQQQQHPQQLYHAQLQAMSQPYHSPYHVHQTEHGKMIGPSGVIET